MSEEDEMTSDQIQEMDSFQKVNMVTKIQILN